MLTKEQIEIIRWVVNVDDVHFSERAVAELRRLALLGLERDERAERVGRAVIEAVGLLANDPDRIADSDEVSISEDTCHGIEVRNAFAVSDEQISILEEIAGAFRAEQRRAAAMEATDD